MDPADGLESVEVRLGFAPLLLGRPLRESFAVLGLAGNREDEPRNMGFGPRSYILPEGRGQVRTLDDDVGMLTHGAIDHGPNAHGYLRSLAVKASEDALARVAEDIAAQQDPTERVVVKPRNQLGRQHRPHRLTHHVGAHQPIHAQAIGQLHGEGALASARRATDEDDHGRVGVAHPAGEPIPAGILFAVGLVQHAHDLVVHLLFAQRRVSMGACPCLEQVHQPHGILELETRGV